MQNSGMPTGLAAHPHPTVRFVYREHMSVTNHHLPLTECFDVVIPGAHHKTYNTGCPFTYSRSTAGSFLE